MNIPAKKDLYTTKTEPWARAPLDYLATTHFAILSRFEESLRYVSLHAENAKAFSHEFSSILRDACSAFGSFSAAFMRASDPERGHRTDPNIRDFFNFYSQYSPDLRTVYVEVRSLLEAPRLLPFSGWTEANAPSWWKAHNNIKHSEYEHIREGNLQNVTNAIAAVEIVLRCATQNEKGTRLFSPAGYPWEPGQQGTEHIKLLFNCDGADMEM